jgi:hypothetical protein
MKAIAVILVILLAANGRPAKAQFGGFSLPGAGGTVLNSIVEQLQIRALSTILASIANNAFEEGRLVIAKQQWACQKLAEAEEILESLSQANISGRVSEIKTKLFCDMTDAIPEEALAPSDNNNDEQGN